MKRNHVIIICIIAVIATLAISASAIYMNELNKNNVQNITQNTTKPIQNNTTIVNNTTIIKEEINYNVEVKEPQKEDSSDRAGTKNPKYIQKDENGPVYTYKNGHYYATTNDGNVKGCGYDAPPRGATVRR